MLSETTQQYSGIKPIILETEEYFNNTNLQYLLPSLDPCDDVFEEGENTLRDTINKPQSCSVSWAFAITNSIEYAVKKMYLEDYGYSMSIALSAQELIDCAGKDHGIENGCEVFLLLGVLIMCLRIVLLIDTIILILMLMVNAKSISFSSIIRKYHN